MGSDGCKNVTDISYFYSIGNRPMNSWDFNNVWSIAYNRTGFPPLLMQGIPIPPPPTPQQNLCSSWFNGMSNFNSIIYLIIGFFVVLIVLGITSLIVMIVKNEGMVDSGDSGLSGVLNFKVVAGALVGLVIVVMVLTIMIASMCGIV